MTTNTVSAIALVLVVCVAVTLGDKSAYAQPHAGTKIIHAYAQRYAPYEWPAWYTRTLMNHNGGTYFNLANHGGKGGSFGTPVAIGGNNGGARVGGGGYRFLRYRK